MILSSPPGGFRNRREAAERIEIASPSEARRSSVSVTLLLDAYGAVGFKLSAQVFPYSDTLVNLTNRDFEIYWQQYANGVDPNEYLDFYFSENGPRNYGSWKSVEYNDLLAKQNAALDSDERNQIIHQMVELLDQEVPRAATNNWTAKMATWGHLHNWHQAYIGVFENIPELIWTEK